MTLGIAPLDAPPDIDHLGELARQLRALHRIGTPLVLVNAWDVASAKQIEQAGCAAVATSSAACAAVTPVCSSIPTYTPGVSPTSAAPPWRRASISC